MKMKRSIKAIFRRGQTSKLDGQIHTPEDLSRASSVTNLNLVETKTKGAKPRKSASRDRLDKIGDKKNDKKAVSKNNNKLDVPETQFTSETLQEVELLQKQLQEMANEKTNLALQLGEHKGQLSLMQNEISKLKLLQEQSSIHLEQLTEENTMLRNRLRDVAHSPLSDNEKQQLLYESHRYHSSAPASIATNILEDGTGGDVTACPTPEWDKQSSGNVSEISVACLQDKINQMQETHYSTNEELQATLQELTDLQRQLTELQQENERLIEEKNLMFDSLCRQTERLNDSRLEVDSLKQLLYQDKDSDQFESAAEREQKLVDLLKSAQEEREELLLKQEQLTTELQESRETSVIQSEEIKQLAERVKTLESTLDAKHAEHKQIDQELAQAKDQCSGRQIEINRLKDMLEIARTKIGELEQDRTLSDKSELDELLDNARKEKDALESEVADLKEQLARSKNEIEKLREQVSILQEECKVIRNNAKTTQSDLEYKNEKLLLDKTALNEQLQQFQDALNELQVQAQCQSEDKRQLSAVLSETQRNLSEAERKIESLENEIAEVQKLRKEENDEWEKFQNDLLTSVRVANDFKTEAQQDLQKMIMENKAHRERVRQLESQIDKLKGNPFVARIFGTVGERVDQGNTDKTSQTKTPIKITNNLIKSSENLPATSSGSEGNMDFESKIKQYSVRKKNVLVVNDVKKRQKPNKNRKEKVLSKEEKQLLSELDTLYKEIDPDVQTDNLSEEQKVVKELKRLYEDKGLRQKPVAPASKDRLAISKPLLGSVYKNPKLQNIVTSPNFIPVENVEILEDDEILDSALIFQQRLKDDSSQPSSSAKSDLHKVKSEYFENRYAGDYMEKQMVKSFSLDNIPVLDKSCGENFGLLRLSSAEDLRKCSDRRTSNVRISVKPFAEKKYFSQTSLDILLRNEDDSVDNDNKSSEASKSCIEISRSKMIVGNSSEDFNHASKIIEDVDVSKLVNTSIESSKNGETAVPVLEVSNARFYNSLLNFDTTNLNLQKLESDTNNQVKKQVLLAKKEKSKPSSKYQNIKVTFINKLKPNQMKKRRTSSINYRTLEEICNSIDPNLPEKQLTNEQIFAKRFLASLNETGRKSTLKKFAKVRTQKITISFPTRESVVRNPKLLHLLQNNEETSGFIDVGNKFKRTVVPPVRHSMFVADNLPEKNIKKDLIKKSNSLNDICFKFYSLERPSKATVENETADENSDHRQERDSSVNNRETLSSENSDDNKQATETQTLSLDIGLDDSEDTSDSNSFYYAKHRSSLPVNIDEDFQNEMGNGEKMNVDNYVEAKILDLDSTNKCIYENIDHNRTSFHDSIVILSDFIDATFISNKQNNCEIEDLDGHPNIHFKDVCSEIVSTYDSSNSKYVEAKTLELDSSNKFTYENIDHKRTSFHDSLVILSDFISREKLNHSDAAFISNKQNNCEIEDCLDEHTNTQVKELCSETVSTYNNSNVKGLQKPDFVHCPDQRQYENDNKSYQYTELSKQINKDQSHCPNLPDICQTVSTVDNNQTNLIENNSHNILEIKDKELYNDICISIANIPDNESNDKCRELKDNCAQISDNKDVENCEDSLDDKKLEHYGALLLPQDNEYERPLGLREIYKNLVREVREKYKFKKTFSDNSDGNISVTRKNITVKTGDICLTHDEIDFDSDYTANTDNKYCDEPLENVELYDLSNHIVVPIFDNSENKCESSQDLSKKEQLKSSREDKSYIECFERVTELEFPILNEDTENEENVVKSTDEDKSYTECIERITEHEFPILISVYEDTENEENVEDPPIEAFSEEICENQFKNENSSNRQLLKDDSLDMERLKKGDTPSCSYSDLHKTNEEAKSLHLLSRSEEDLVNTVKQRYSAALSELNDFDIDLIERLKQRYLSFDTEIDEDTSCQGDISNAIPSKVTFSEEDLEETGPTFHEDENCINSIESAKISERSSHTNEDDICYGNFEDTLEGDQLVDDLIKDIKIPPHEETEREVRKLSEAINTEAISSHKKIDHKELPVEEDEYEELLHHGIVLAMRDNDTESFEFADIAVSDVLRDHENHQSSDNVVNDQSSKEMLEPGIAESFISTGDFKGSDDKIINMLEPKSYLEGSKDITCQKSNDNIDILESKPEEDCIGDMGQENDGNSVNSGTYKLQASEDPLLEKPRGKTNEKTGDFESYLTKSKVHYEPVYANISIFSRKPSSFSSFSSSKKPVALPRRKRPSLETESLSFSATNPSEEIKCSFGLVSEAPQKKVVAVDVSLDSDKNTAKNEGGKLKEQNSSWKRHTTDMEPGSSDQISNIVQASSSQVKVLITEKSLDTDTSVPKVFGAVERFYETQDSNAIPGRILTKKELCRKGGAIKKEVDTGSNNSSIKRATKFSGLVPMTDITEPLNSETEDENSACGYNISNIPRDIPEEREKLEHLSKVQINAETLENESQLNLFHMDSPPISRSYLDMFKSKEQKMYEDMSGSTKNRISGFIRVTSLEEDDESGEFSLYENKRNSVTHLKHMFEIRDDCRENLVPVKKPDPSREDTETYGLPKDDMKKKRKEIEEECAEKTVGDFKIPTNKKDKPKIVDYVSSSSSSAKKASGSEPLPTYDSLERIAAFHVLNNTPSSGKQSETGIRKSESSIQRSNIDTRKSFTDAKKVFEQLEQNSSAKSSSGSSLNLKNLQTNSSEGFKTSAKQESPVDIQGTSQPQSFVSNVAIPRVGSESKVNETSAEELNFLGAVDSVEFHEYKMRERMCCSQGCNSKDSNDSKDSLRQELGAGSSKPQDDSKVKSTEPHSAVLRSIQEDDASYGELKQYKRKIILSESDKLVSKSELAESAVDKNLSSCEQFDKLLDRLKQEFKQEKDNKQLESKYLLENEHDSGTQLDVDSCMTVTQPESEFATDKCYSDGSRAEHFGRFKDKLACDGRLSNNSQDDEVEQNNFTYNVNEEF